PDARPAPCGLRPRDPQQQLMQPRQRRLPLRPGAAEHPQPLGRVRVKRGRNDRRLPRTRFRRHHEQDATGMPRPESSGDWLTCRRRLPYESGPGRGGWTMADKTGGISDLLHEAGETHHRVYRIVDGADPDWASWYADWLINLSELPDLLGARPVRSELV